MSWAFQSTPSVRRVTGLHVVPFAGYNISIHTLRAEGDDVKRRICRLPLEISIHTLRAEGDCTVPSFGWVSPAFQSTPSVRTVTIQVAIDLQILDISIHTLRAEGD